MAETRRSNGAAPLSSRPRPAPPAIVEAHEGWPRRGGGDKARRARAELARVLWKGDGSRRLPRGAVLDRALTALRPSDLGWICELSPLAPLYFLPTVEFVRALARTLDALGVRRVVEVAAGDGFLSRALRGSMGGAEVMATDSGAWERPAARMRAAERRALAGTRVPGLTLGADVQKVEARRAVRALAPDLVLCAWLPPGSRLLDALIRAPVRYVLEIGAGSGITASAYSWRFAHEFLEGAVEERARCRLDARPAEKLHSRVTLYYGAAHPEHYEERVRPGDWLHQFKPQVRG